MLKTNINLLINKTPHHTVYLTPEDIDMFERYTHEFVYHQNSLLDDFYNPQMNATTIITDLIKHYDKDITKGLLQGYGRRIQSIQLRTFTPYQLVSTLKGNYAPPFCIYTFRKIAPYRDSS